MKLPRPIRSQRTATNRPGQSTARRWLLSLEHLEERQLLAEIPVPNAGFEERETFDSFPDGTDKYNQFALESWRHFECSDNGGPLRIWNPGDPENPSHLTAQGALDVGFGGNAPEGDYVVVARSRDNDDGCSDPPRVRDFEAATQLLDETFDATMTYRLTAKVGRLPETTEGGSGNYDPNWYGYALQLAVGGINVGGARFAGRVDGGTVIAQDWNSLTVPVNEFVTSTVTYAPDPAHADLAGEPLQIRLAVLEDPDDHSTTGWAAFDDVRLSVEETAQADLEVESISVNTGIDDIIPDPLPNGSEPPTSWAGQRSDIGSIQVTFSRPVGAVTMDHLELTNHGIDGTENNTVDLTNATISSEDRVLTVRFDAHALNDGSFSLKLLPELSAALVGNQPDGSYRIVANDENKFFKMEANWNGDTGVSIFDFPAFAYWFGLATEPVGPAATYMDLNDDGGVSIFDFNKFAANFGRGVMFPTAVVNDRTVGVSLVVPENEEPIRQVEKTFRVMDHPLDRRGAVTQLPLLETHRRTGDLNDPETDIDQRDLEQILDEIGADIFAAWSSW